MQDDLIMAFSPEINYYGEKILTVKFYNVEDLYCGASFFRCIFQPVITIKDISPQGYETIRYYVDETENKFYFYCDELEYRWNEKKL